MRAKIVRWGNSQGIRLPKLLLESVDIKYDDVVEVTTENNSIIIRKTGKKREYRTIQERFESFTGVYDLVEVDWGKPAGKEIW